jgi:hypothetical protein
MRQAAEKSRRFPGAGRVTVTELSGLSVVARVTRGRVSVRSDTDKLRLLVIGAGICVAVLFVFLGLRYQLQTYADGSLFSYAVAVRDAWAFHCHNIAGRLSVYLFAFAPAEAYVQLTGDPQGGIALYGFLFFVAQLLGLLATYAADRSQSRVIFNYACASTACLCPLVFGFPTEVWVMHALFWPTLAVCHYKQRGIAEGATIFGLMLAMVLTHAGALIAALAIVVTTALRGWHAHVFRRAGKIFLFVLASWIIVKLTLLPDEYVSRVLIAAALHVFDVSILTGPLMLLFYSVLAGYGLAFVVLQRLSPERSHVYAGVLVVLALAAYWLRFDHSLHAANRYYMRTVLLITTPVFGVLAAAFAVASDGDLNLALPQLPRLLAFLSGETMLRAVTGAFALVLLVHAVETAKFTAAWTGYRTALRTLAMGTASDPALGDPRFVSATRNRLDYNPLSWVSTTHFLSVLLAPGMKPARLVVDPDATYFWLSCETATENAQARRPAPQQSRELVRVYSCLHRKRRAATTSRF